MNLIPKELYKSSGIYKIKNMLNGKVYVGKTVCLNRRYTAYKAAYKRRDNRAINEYLMRSIEKNGPENFNFELIEVCPIDELSEKELYWMVELKSTDRDFGYNLRMDSSTKMITHPLTSEKISQRVKKEFELGIRSREKCSEWASNLWKCEDRKDRMKQALSDSKMSYFIQSTREGECVAVWAGIHQIMRENPEWKWQNIYAACNGSKKSYQGFLWQRVDSIPDSLKHKVKDADGSLVDNLYRQDRGSHIKKSPIYSYTIVRDGVEEEVSVAEIKADFPNVYSSFHRTKKDEAVYKGFLFRRIKIRK